jgi:hypothetical protein
MGMTLSVESGLATQVEWSASEALHSKDYSIGVDGMSRADKYATGKGCEPTALDVLSHELS